MNFTNFILILFVPLLTFLSCNENIAPKQQKSNIILIMLDDVSPSLFGIYGLEGSARTPHIDALGKEGVVFQTCYATSMCAPSRVELFTGRYPDHTGVYRNNLWLDNSSDSVFLKNSAISKRLSEGGYTTAIAGKWNLKSSKPWDEESGFHEYCIWLNNINSKRRLIDVGQFDGFYEREKMTSRYWHPAFIRNGQLLDTDTEDFGPDIELEFIKNFIQSNVKDDKPFFALWSSVAPHVMMGSPAEYPSIPKNDIIKPNEENGSRDRQSDLLQLVEYMDHLIGQLIEFIGEQGIAENTIIIFTSDNPSSNDGKLRGTEKGALVPFIVKGAGILKRGLTKEMMDFTDIAPTILDLANLNKNLTSGDQADGISLKLFLYGDVSHTKEWIYSAMAGSQVVRNRNYLLEAVNPMLGLPRGRFYYTGPNRYGENYTIIPDSTSNGDYLNERAIFDQFLTEYPPLTLEHPYFSSPEGLKFLDFYTDPKRVKKHLTDIKLIGEL